MEGRLGRVPGNVPGRFSGRLICPGKVVGRFSGRLTCPGSVVGRFGIEGLVIPLPFPPPPSPPPRPAPPPPGRENWGGVAGRVVGRLTCGAEKLGRPPPPRFGELGRVAGDGRETGDGRDAGLGLEAGAGRDIPPPPPPPGRAPPPPPRPPPPPPPRPRAWSSLVPQQTVTANTSVVILRNMCASSLVTCWWVRESVARPRPIHVQASRDHWSAEAHRRSCVQSAGSSWSSRRLGS